MLALERLHLLGMLTLGRFPLRIGVSPQDLLLLARVLLLECRQLGRVLIAHRCQLGRMLFH